MKRYSVISFLLVLSFIAGLYVESYLEKRIVKSLAYSNPIDYLDIETYDGGGEGLHPVSF